MYSNLPHYIHVSEVSHNSALPVSLPFHFTGELTLVSLTYL